MYHFLLLTKRAAFARNDGDDMNIRAVIRTAKLSLLENMFSHQKSIAGCETLLLLHLLKTVTFHYNTGQHLHCYLGQSIFNSILMVLQYRVAHQDILCAAEDSSSGQMKICSCSFSKWVLTANHMPDTVQGWGQLRHGLWSP